jgi:hypothetical protein
MPLPGERTSRQRSTSEPISWTPRLQPTDADWAEGDAADAIDYAILVVSDAQLAVLDALDARAYAEERAKIAAT